MKLIHIEKNVLLYIVFFELLNGILVYFFNFQYFSKIFYSLLLISLTVSISLKNNKILDRIFLIFLFSIFITLLKFNNSFSEIYTDINYMLRSLLLFYVVYYYCDNNLYKKHIFFNKFKKVQVIIFYSISILIIIHRFFNIGGTYRFASDMVRGTYFSFFGSGNTIIAIYLLSLIFVLFNSNKIVFLFNSILVVFVILLTGSKLGLIMSVCTILFILSYFIKQKNRTLGNFIYVLGITLFILIVTNLEKSIQFFLRILLNYSSEGSKIENSNLEIMDFLFSRRNIQIENSISIFLEDSVFIKLFGNGITMFKDKLGSLSNYEELTMVESDFFDILGSFGIIGLILYFSPILKSLFILMKSYISSNNNSEILIIILCLSIFLAVGVLSGHVFLNPLSSVYLALLIAFAKNIYQKKSIYVKTYNK
jgi:hypothetical protein